MSDERKKELCIQISKALKEKREQRNLTYDDISQAIKIRIPLIKAMEEGHWEDTPGGVYLKGFLTKYASYLGLEAEKLVNPYFAEIEQEEKEIQEQEEETTDQYDNRARIWWIYAGVGLVILMGLFKFLSNDSDEKVVPADHQPVAVATAPVNAIPPDVNLVNEPIIPVETHTLEVYTPHQLWLRVDAQDKTFEGFIPENSTWTWHGAGQMIIRLGHTRDLSLYFDETLIPIEENQKRITLPNES